MLRTRLSEHAVRRACPLWKQETGRNLGVGSKSGPVGGKLWSNTDQHWPGHQGETFREDYKDRTEFRENTSCHTNIPPSSSSNQEPEVNKHGDKRNGGSTQLLCGPGEQFS